MALAAEKPARLLLDPIAVNGFLCSILRSEMPEWPFADDVISQQSFLKLAHEQGLRPLIFEKMQGSPQWQAWPNAIREQLVQERREGIAIDMLRAHHVGHITSMLTQNGVEFLLTKGEALAHTLYPEPGLRPRVDTDLFIDLKHIEAVKRLFQGAGYTVIPPIYKTHQFMAVGNLQGFPLTFDVHWRILNSPRFARILAFREVLATSVPVPGIENARTVGPIDALLLACMHRSGSDWHDQERLLWLYDIHLMISNLDSAGWSELVSKAISKGIQSTVRDGLMRSVSSLSSPVPAEALEQLIVSGSDDESKFKRRISQSNLALLMDDWIHLPGIKSRLGLLRELFLPPIGELEEQYGKRNRLVLILLGIGYVLSRTLSRLRLK